MGRKRTNSSTKTTPVKRNVDSIKQESQKSKHVPFICEICEFSCLNITTLKEHIDEVHAKKDGLEDNDNKAKGISQNQGEHDKKQRWLKRKRRVNFFSPSYRKMEGRYFKGHTPSKKTENVNAPIEPKLPTALDILVNLNEKKAK